MTSIVGYIDRENGITYLGGDSLASNSYYKEVIKQRKVFKSNDSKNMIIGFSGALRDLDLLTYAENLIDKRDEPNIDHKYMVTKFIPNIIQLFKNNDRNDNCRGVSEIESCFLVAYKDKLWTIESNYCVTELVTNYTVIGSGMYYALGSLKTTEGMDLTPIEKIHLALQSASEFAPEVAPPFYIINTENDDVVEFKD
jgi:ATP-dependent protease HslVU (ClpYQ) peptidase subunit